MTIPWFCFSRLLHVQWGCEHGHPGAVLRHLLPRPLLRLCRGIGEGVLRAEHPRAVGGPGLSTIQSVNILSAYFQHTFNTLSAYCQHTVSICQHLMISCCQLELWHLISVPFSSITFNQFSMHAFSVFGFSNHIFWTVSLPLNLFY